jgi:hypothetical protein
MPFTHDEGLCATCAHALTTRSSKGATFVRCELSLADARFPRYPILPVRACDGYAPKSPVRADAV